MLYFEDFMEDIEDLPYDFKENLTAMRQLDLQVQNIMEPLDNRINNFFSGCSQNGFNVLQQQTEYEKIVKEFEDVETKNSEKIGIVDQMKDTFNKMIKKLDNELAKFKLELEADNPGSAEAIERNVNQDLKAGVSDSNQRVERKRQRRGRMANISEGGGQAQVSTRKIMRMDPSCSASAAGGGMYSHKLESLSTANSLGQNDALMTTAVANGSMSPGSSVTGNTIFSSRRKHDSRSATSSATDKTYTKSERRRLKIMSTTSEDSGTNEEFGYDEVIESDMALGGRNRNFQNDTVSEAGSGRTPGSLNFGLSCSSSYGGGAPSSAGLGGPLDGGAFMLPPPSSAAAANAASSAGALCELEDEPRYCVCNEVSHGPMIACDGPNCPLEWFHYACVFLTVAPKGCWYCQECKQKLKHYRR